ncbi:hypothetical protein V8E54_015162 [Elaphomyces granulatus]
MHIPSVQGEELSDNFDPKSASLLQPVKLTSSKQMPSYIQLPPRQSRHRSSLLQALSPPALAFQGFVIRSGDAMNRGATLLHYDFRVVTYTSGPKSHNQFTIRAYLKNGKRWVKFPSLSNYTKMLVVGRDLWDRTDADDIGEGPSISSSSKPNSISFKAG